LKLFFKGPKITHPQVVRHEYSDSVEKGSDVIFNSSLKKSRVAAMSSVAI
jgi:hypothetical protein